MCRDRWCNKVDRPAPQPAASHDGNRVFASPLARRIAAQKGIDLAALSGTGPRGRIVKSDVEAAKPGAKPKIATGPAPAKPAAKAPAKVAAAGPIAAPAAKPVAPPLPPSAKPG